MEDREEDEQNGEKRRDGKEGGRRAGRKIGRRVSRMVGGWNEAGRRVVTLLWSVNRNTGAALWGKIGVHAAASQIHTPVLLWSFHPR